MTADIETLDDLARKLGRALGVLFEPGTEESWDRGAAVTVSTPEAGRVDAWEVAIRDLPTNSAPFMPALNRVHRRASVFDISIVLLAAARREAVDMGPCLACDGSKIGAARAEGASWRSIAAKRRWLGPCSACTVGGEPTGRDARSLQKLVVDAMPRSEHLGGWDYESRGNQESRDALAVYADKLQARGEPFGELLSAWLAGDCPGCCEKRLPDRLEPASGWPSLMCSACHGARVLVGGMLDELVAAMKGAWEQETTECTACGAHIRYAESRSPVVMRAADGGHLHLRPGQRFGVVVDPNLKVFGRDGQPRQAQLGEAVITMCSTCNGDGRTPRTRGRPHEL